MAELEINGNATGAIKAIGETSKALDGLGRKAKSTNVAPDGSSVRRLSSDVKALEAAGRVAGGRFGELTGALGDFTDIAEVGLSPISAVGIGIGLMGTAAVGAVAGMVALTRSAIDVATETGRMNIDLLGAQRAMEAASMASDALTIQLGTYTAGAVEKLGYAFVGLASEAGKAAEALSEKALSFEAQVAFQALEQVSPSVYFLGTGLSALAAQGKQAAESLRDVGGATNDLENQQALLESLGMFEPKDVTTGREREQAAARRRAEQERAEAARRQAEMERAEAAAAAEADRQETAYIARRKAELADMLGARQAAHDFQMRLNREDRDEKARTAEEDARLAKEAMDRAAEVARQWEDSYAIQRDAAQTTANAAIDLLGLVLGESKEAAIAMLVLRKAQAIADIIISTQVASAQATAQLGVAAPPAVAAIQAAGAAQVAVVAATGIAEGVALGAQPASQQGQTNNFTLVVDGMPRRNAVRQRGPVGQR